MSTDYYELLGVSREATEDEIKKAFRKGARELHPDVNKDPDAEERFKELARAYEVLSDSDKRSSYDRFGEEGLAGSAGPDFADFSTFEQLFDTFFGGAGEGFGFGRSAAAGAGQDQIVDVQIDFVESARGTTRAIDVELIAPCDACEGTGAAENAELTTCETCGGSGHVEQVQRTVLGQVVRRSTCPHCEGMGRSPSERCTQCVGRGRRAANQTVEVSIPAGIESGQRIALRGRGHAGAPGMPAGDLYVQVTVAPDERFVRDGLDIISSVSVPVTDAMTGTAVSVATVHGEEEIILEPGTQPNQEIVLQDKGFPAINRRGNGNHRVIVEVQVPRVDTPDARTALEAFSETLGEKAYLHGGDDGLFGRLKQAFR
jgi:molecular chaperone DnaJ